MHEFAHLFMTILLYPFGTRLLGIKIILTKEHGYKFQGRVYTSCPNGISVILTSAAPMIFWVFAVIVFLIMRNPYLYFSTFLFLDSMGLSSIDKQNCVDIIKGRLPSGTVKENELVTTLKQYFD